MEVHVQQWMFYARYDDDDEVLSVLRATYKFLGIFENLVPVELIS